MQGTNPAAIVIIPEQAPFHSTTQINTLKYALAKDLTIVLYHDDSSWAVIELDQMGRGIMRKLKAAVVFSKFLTSFLLLVVIVMITIV
ncbi:hypothetical protein KK060_21510 [Fulvivirgaceae bacterium PWU20]|uniref:Uncharacterized protein n=1 Tax=Chryseosolibacter indicus TaxID=2782351 RepID=A0ABS5VWT5_9BACT|nr:hypothetical protein [Chryseosolibacter indicus]